MKHISIASMLVVCCSFIILNEKTFFAFNIYQVNEKGTPKAPLEKAQATLTAAKGSKTASSVYEIQGGKSTRRIMAIEALFRTTSDNISAKTDPATVIQLYKLATSKTKRSFSLTPDIKVPSFLIPLSFQPEDFLNFKILLQSFLAPGEYAFIDRTTASSDGSVTVFTFGID